MLFVPERDFQFLERNNAELFRKSFRKISLYKRDRETKLFDAVYTEAADQNPLKENLRYDIPAWVHLNPLKSEWTKFGVRDKRDVMVMFSAPLLRQGYIPEGETVPVPYPEPDRGDFVVIEGDAYEIKDLTQQLYHGNTERYMVIVAFGINYRPSSMRDRELSIIAKDNSPPVSETYRGYEGDDDESPY